MSNSRTIPFIIGMIFTILAYVIYGVIALFQLAFNPDYRNDAVPVIIIIAFTSSIVFRYQYINQSVFRIIILSDVVLTIASLRRIIYDDFDGLLTGNNGALYILIGLVPFILDWRNRYWILRANLNS